MDEQVTITVPEYITLRIERTAKDGSPSKKVCQTVISSPLRQDNTHFRSLLENKNGSHAQENTHFEADENVGFFCFGYLGNDVQMAEGLYYKDNPQGLVQRHNRRSISRQSFTLSQSRNSAVIEGSKGSLIKQYRQVSNPALNSEYRLSEDLLRKNHQINSKNPAISRMIENVRESFESYGSCDKPRELGNGKLKVLHVKKASQLINELQSFVASQRASAELEQNDIDRSFAKQESVNSMNMDSLKMIKSYLASSQIHQDTKAPTETQIMKQTSVEKEEVLSSLNRLQKEIKKLNPEQKNLSVVENKYIEQINKELTKLKEHLVLLDPQDDESSDNGLIEYAEDTTTDQFKTYV